MGTYCTGGSHSDYDKDGYRLMQMSRIIMMRVMMPEDDDVQ